VTAAADRIVLPLLASNYAIPVVHTIPLPCPEIGWGALQVVCALRRTRGQGEWGSQLWSIVDISTTQFTTGFTDEVLARKAYLLV